MADNSDNFEFITKKDLEEIFQESANLFLPETQEI